MLFPSPITLLACFPTRWSFSPQIKILLLMLLVAVACCMAIAVNTITICHNAVSIGYVSPCCQHLLTFPLLNQIHISSPIQCHICLLSLGPSVLADCFFLSEILYFVVNVMSLLPALCYCWNPPPVQIADYSLCQSAATSKKLLIVSLLLKKCWCSFPLLLLLL